MKQSSIGKSIAVLAALLLVFSAAMVGTNIFTAPLAAENDKALDNASLFAVLPEASGFSQIFDAADAGASVLKDVPANVVSIFEAEDGLGYALKLSNAQDTYTKEPLQLTMAVTPEGRITGIQLDAYPETKDFGADYPSCYIGQDSTLADVGLVSGVTYSCTAFRNAVTDGFQALISNGLMKEGVKSEAQLLSELALTVHTGLANAAGAAQTEELEPSGDMQKILKALNGSGFAYVLQNGKSAVLAVTNALGGVRLYNAEGTDVTQDFPALAEQALAHTQSSIESFAAKDEATFGRMLEGVQSSEALTLGGVFNSVTTAMQLTTADGVYYGFAARSYAYSNIPSGVYYILDEQGAIVSMTADELIIFPDYFTEYTLDEAAYKQGFAGLTSDSWTGDQAIVSGATVTTEAVTDATNDVFEAFASLQLNGGAEE